MKKMAKIMTAVGIIGGMTGCGIYLYKNADKMKIKKYMNYIMK